MSRDENRSRAGRLLDELCRLETFEDVLADGRFRDEELLSLLHGPGRLTERQRLALALSPADRQRLGELRQLERAKVLLRWREAGRATPRVSLRAAAGDAIEPLTLEGGNFRVRLIPFDLAGKVWKILVELPAELAVESPSGFRLLDSEGLVWVLGHPNTHGELIGYWERKESLWERAHRVELVLLPL